MVMGLAARWDVVKLGGCMADKRRHQSNRWHRLWKVAVLLGAGSLLLATLVVWAVGQGQFLMAPLSYLPRVWAGVLLLGLAIAGWKWDRRWATGAGLWALFYLLVVLEWRTPRPVKEVVDELKRYG